MSEGESAGLGYWYPSHVLPELPDQLPMPVPTDSWVRVLPDAAAGMPLVHVQLAWVTRPVLHLVTAAGFTMGDGDDSDDVEIREHRRISLENVDRLNLDVETGHATVEFSEGEPLEDAPGILLNQHLHTKLKS
jgi:hypothetical protein